MRSLPFFHLRIFLGNLYVLNNEKSETIGAFNYVGNLVKSLSAVSASSSATTIVIRDINTITKEFVNTDASILEHQQGNMRIARVTGVADFAKTYYKHLHSQYQDKLLSLIYIKTAIDTMIEKQIPFIMTYIDDLIFETEWHSSPAIQELQEYIRPHMVTFEGQNFLDWAKEKGFPISETLHPLEEAHQAAFELIKSYNLV